MENKEYYESLTEKIFFKGLKSEEVSSFVEYKLGKNLKI